MSVLQFIFKINNSHIFILCYVILFLELLYPKNTIKSHTGIDITCFAIPSCGKDMLARINATAIKTI